MGVSWTEEQQKVIDTRNCNILVSAAAGSGKTAVLVERIIKRITGYREKAGSKSRRRTSPETEHFGTSCADYHH